MSRRKNKEPPHTFWNRASRWVGVRLKHWKCNHCINANTRYWCCYMRSTTISRVLTCHRGMWAACKENDPVQEPIEPAGVSTDWTFLDGLSRFPDWPSLCVRHSERRHRRHSRTEINELGLWRSDVYLQFNCKTFIQRVTPESGSGTVA